MELSTNIKFQRKKANFTQKELADKLGVTIRTIQNYESGKREPNFETLIKIAAALNVSLEELISVPATKEVIEKWDNEIDVMKLQEDAKVAGAIDLLLKEKGHNIKDFTEEEFEKIKNSLLEYLDTIAYMKK